MKLIDLYMTYKNQYPNCIVMIKVGVFYELYDIDAYIISNLTNYKINENNKEKKLGFPILCLTKIEELLELNKINYLIVEKNEIYKITKNKSFKNNNYKNIKNKALDVYEINNRIDNIYDYLKKYKKNDIIDVLSYI